MVTMKWTLDIALHAHHSCVELEHQEGRLLENHGLLRMHWNSEGTSTSSYKGGGAQSGRTSTMAGLPPWQDLHHGRISTMAGPPPWQEIDLGALSITHSVAVETNVSSLQCSLQTITYENDFVKRLMCLVYS